MAKGSGATRSSSNSGGGGMKTTSYGDHITSLSRNFIFDNPDVGEAIRSLFPGISFGSSGDKLTISPSFQGDSGERTPVVPQMAKAIETQLKELKTVKTKSFDSLGGGEYQLDTNIGFAQILEGGSAGTKYYEGRVWDSRNRQGRPFRAADLNRAKEMARAEIIRRYVAIDKSRG